jgi:hypothetical protein
MYYVICTRAEEQDGPLYQFYKFESLEDMRYCELVDEYSVVYNGEAADQLAECCTKDELDMIWRMCDFDHDSLAHLNKSYIAQEVHLTVVGKAILWKPDKETTMSSVAPLVHEDAPVTEAPKAKQSRPRFNKNAKIVPLIDAPNLREGTNRYRNMQVILASATVAEAMDQLRALQPAPGGGVDIKIAIKAGAIKLED